MTCGGGWREARVRLRLLVGRLPYVKLGRTVTSPHQRLGEVNTSSAYASSGPWHLLDCRQVADCFAVEAGLHLNAGARADIGTGASELFALSRADALALLAAIPLGELYAPAPVERLRLEPALLYYLFALFEQTGLEAFLDQQEAWTFTLFPSTAGGRTFTLNIGRHEVAFSTLPLGDPDAFPVPMHEMVMDSLVLRDRAVRDWVRDREGAIETAGYASAMRDAVSLHFFASFEDALGLFQLEGARRAIIAYWFDALLRMRRRGTRSLFAKHHDYSAVSAIMGHMREVRRFRGGLVTSAV